MNISSTYALCFFSDVNVLRVLNFFDTKETNHFLETLVATFFL